MKPVLSATTDERIVEGPLQNKKSAAGLLLFGAVRIKGITVKSTLAQPELNTRIQTSTIGRRLGGKFSVSFKLRGHFQGHSGSEPVVSPFHP